MLQQCLTTMASPYHIDHYENVGPSIGNQTLWIFFTKNHEEEYRFSINGPLTSVCKDKIAQELHRVMTNIMNNDATPISDL